MEQESLEKEITVLVKELNAIINKKSFTTKEVDFLWEALLDKVDELETDKKKQYSTMFRNQRWTSNHLKIKKAIEA